MAIINKDEIKGKFEQGKGTIKDKVGEVTGNRRIEAEGEAEHAEGETRESWGKFKRGVSNAVDSVGDAINDALDAEPDGVRRWQIMLTGGLVEQRLCLSFTK